MGEPKATKPLLELLSVTYVALPPGHIQRTKEQAARDDEWGLDVLELHKACVFDAATAGIRIEGDAQFHIVLCIPGRSPRPGPESGVGRSLLLRALSLVERGG